jgi:formylglycine-generating enzyme required for sulfatase activity
MKTLLSLCILGSARVAIGQTASPMTPPPTFPQAAPFSPKSAPASARQQSAMVQIRGGAYTVGSPARHPLANKAAMPEHRVELKPFRIDRTEVTSLRWGRTIPPSARTRHNPRL